ncbi:MAG: GNAT family N-acetyltransferase [Lachnospiraceae bacterium]|nr:GNAT family N-acetyltransferase [Lachnospiraceae bacterium]
MNIRRAKDSDLKEINELLAQVDLVHHIIRPDLFNIGNKYTDEQVLEIIKDEKTPVFVAVDENDKTMGYAFCMFKQHLTEEFLTDIKTLYIDDLCVYEHLRGQHVGRALYDYVCNFAKENGCYNITLNVWEGNDSAKRFYESVGMKPQKTGMEMILQ